MQALARTIEQRFQVHGIPTFVQPAAPDTLDLLEQFGSAVSVQRDREIHAQGDQANSCYRTLLSGQKVNSFNWLLSSVSSNRSGVAKIADWIGIFSNTVTEKTCSNV